MDIIRRLSLGGDGLVNPTEGLTEIRSERKHNVFRRAVVSKTLDDLTAIDFSNEEEIEQITSVLTNPEDFNVAPRNSAIVKFIDAGQGRSNVTQTVCFPFFSSHLCLPLKVGEQVWVMQEDPENPLGRGFWMSRIHEPVFVEDPNYTHGDRRYDPLNKEENVEIGEDGKEIELSNVPTFHNGILKTMTDADQWTLGKGTEYESYYTGSIESNQFIIEPVPRFTKRPGDLVLQGSHNSSIVLGTDRGYKAEDAIDRKKSNASTKEKISPLLGSVDIVAGRGRIFSNDFKKLEEKEPTRTDPRIIKNEPGSTEKDTEGRGVHHETDKNLTIAFAEDSKEKSNSQTDGCEGDPDFVNDASRIYVSMKTSPDKNFTLDYPKCPPVGETNDGKDVKPTDDTAAIVVKSDEIRIVARQMGLDSQKSAELSGDNKPEKPIAGSIKIIKEGKPDDEAGEGRAVIMMQPDGVIMIDGPKVVIGSGIETANGKGSQVSIGLGATEPLVLGNEIKTLLDKFFDDLKTFLSSKYDTHTHPTGTGPSGPPVVTGDDAGSSSAKGSTEKFLSKVAMTK